MSVTAAAAGRRVDQIEHAAAFDLWQALATTQGDGAGVLVADVDGCLTIGTPQAPDVPMLNRVMGAGPEHLASGALDRAVGLLHDEGCTCLVAVLAGDPGDAAVAARLRSRGFAAGYAWMKFVHGGVVPSTAGMPPPRVRVRRCDSPDRARFGEVLVRSYGLPAALAAAGDAVIGRSGWDCFIAETDDGTGVGVGALFVQGDTAWLGLGATVPEARGLGAQGAILRARIAHARARGCELIVTETGERVDDRPSISYRNILRCGFVEHGLRQNLIGAPERAGGT